jgi:hypothetical protein
MFTSNIILQRTEEDKIYNYFMQGIAMAHTANMTAPEEVIITLPKLKDCGFLHL